MTIAKETMIGDWSSINLTYTRKDNEKRVRVKMEYCDVLSGNRTIHTATLENVGKYPDDDRKKMIYEMRLLYLNIHKGEFGLTNPRPTVSQFEKDKKYRWWRTFNMPTDIFY